MESLMAGKNNVTHLNLMHNNLQELPDSSLVGYPHLIYLSLAYNNISTLTYKAFEGLKNLTTLCLSHNPLRSIKGNLSGLLFSLSVLYVTGIEYWVLDKPLLELPKLKHITDVILPSYKSEGYCGYCSFNRSNLTWTPLAPFVDKSGCYLRRHSVNMLSSVAQLLNGSYFHIQCNNRNIFKCKHNKINFYTYYIENSCWKEKIVVIKCQSSIGFLAALLNLVVFWNIMTSTHLRKNVSMLFVGNMALSDLLIGIYYLHIGVYLSNTTFSYIHSEGCPLIGFLWMLGQAGSVITSFLLTLERYLVIVYSLNPNIRITRRMAMTLIFVCWLLSAFLTAYGWSLYYELYQYSYLTMCIPIRLSVNTTANIFVFTLTIGSIGILFYVVSFILYVCIFITVRRAAGRAGVKRESKLAKRIGILVGSNIIFFVAPLLFSGLIIISDRKKFSSSTFQEIATEILIPFCVCVNSFLNPVIHAFRTDLFKTVLKERFSVARSNLFH
ncbi:probable glycoprotein hormone G-protein coupled receptor [Actinia tenebrosa]|uniref:Probable glycoprotein hormone G-protein coupled receptor n=1 Tax=Actinia tenebrosa TaxID=6105 RepID=A0A6P8IZC9_ACTTE|nr:probable glycoprotein hormone G-protein coupled receptor [Actinia tenebrosa]